MRFGSPLAALHNLKMPLLSLLALDIQVAQDSGLDHYDRTGWD